MIARTGDAPIHSHRHARATGGHTCSRVGYSSVGPLLVGRRWTAPIRLLRQVASPVHFLLAVLGAFVFPVQDAWTQELKVLIRYDDFDRSSNAAMEDQLFEAVKKAGGRTLVGVIPYTDLSYPRPDESPPALTSSLGAAKLKQLTDHLTRGDITVALHGYSHVNHSSAGAPKSELAGMSAQVQSHLLTLAKTQLEDALQTKLDVFIPPWDRYDEHTIGVLYELGFRVLSGGFEHFGRSEGVQFLPGGVVPRFLKTNVSAALKEGHLEGILVVIAHPYDFSDQGVPNPAWRPNAAQPSIADMGRDIAWVGKQARVRVVSLEELRHDEDLSLARLEANARLRESYLGRANVIPEAFGLTPIPGLLYPRDIAQGLIWKQRAAAGVIYGGSGLLAFLATAQLRRRFRLLDGIPVRALAAALALAIVFLGIYATVQRMSVMIVLAISVCAGAFLALMPVLGRRGQSS